MKEFLATILFFFMTVFSTFGQEQDTVFIKYNQDKWAEKPNYTTDTVIFDNPNERQLLYGTTVLPWTQKQQIAKGYGLYLEKVSMTPCEQELWERPDMKNQVLVINQIEDSLTIEIKYWGNCCHSFLCDLEIMERTTINLLIYGYGAMYCDCTCCFGLTFHLNTMEVDEFHKLKYITINGEERTKKQLK